MDKPTISIITPVYKVERCLPRCIESVLKRTFSNWEMLLINDGSPDSYGIICNNYAKQDNRIKTFHKKNGGPSSARNLGLEHARGKYIWFVDSDDWIEKDALQKIMDTLIHGDTDICFFGLNTVSDTATKPLFDYHTIIGEHQDYVIYKNKHECAQAIANLEVCGGMGWTWNKWFKKNVIDKNGLRFDERFAIQEDHLFTLSYLLHTETISLTRYAPYNYVVSEGSLLFRKHPYENMKALNDAMYTARCCCCKKFGILDPTYIKWFSSDYASRMVSNLAQIPSSSLSMCECMREISEVNKYIQGRNISSARIRRYRLIQWMPNRIIYILLSMTYFLKVFKKGWKDKYTHFPL